MEPKAIRQLVLEPADNERLANLCGQFNQNLRQIEERLGVAILSRGNRFRIEGAGPKVEQALWILNDLFKKATRPIPPEDVHLSLQNARLEAAVRGEEERVVLKTRRLLVEPRGGHQTEYVKKIQEHDINFGIGPAGTGKTYLAVACAVVALDGGQVERLILTRPAVEAGERLGFLPGDLAQKVDPYLRPLYDALYEMLGFERVAKLIEKNIIEIAPLAFMRGRSLNHAFIILDEAQNTTPEQLKMFLTRIGFGSKAVITGDLTQVDLPKEKPSGLRQAMEVLRGIEGISWTFFDSSDVVRHPLVQKVVLAYEAHEREKGGRG